MSGRPRSEVIEIADGLVQLWLEYDEPLMLKTVGIDPVELTKEEAIDLANSLLRFASLIRD